MENCVDSAVDKQICQVAYIKKQMLKKANRHLIASQRHESPSKKMQHNARALEILNNVLNQKSFGAPKRLSDEDNESEGNKKSRNLWVDTRRSREESTCKRLMSVGEGFTLEPASIEARRKAVHTQLTKDGKRTVADILTTETMYKMLDLYDKEFFSSLFLFTLRSIKCCLAICIDDTCAVCPDEYRSFAAYCECTNNNKTQTIHMLTHKFVDLEKRRGAVFENDIYAEGNIPCGDILECIMLIFEHELVHTIVAFFCPSMGFVTNTELDKLELDQNHFAKIYNAPQFASVWNDWKENAAHKGNVGPADGHSVIFMGILVNLFRHGGYRTYLGNAEKEEHPQEYPLSDIIKTHIETRTAYTSNQDLVFEVDSAKTVGSNVVFCFRSCGLVMRVALKEFRGTARDKQTVINRELENVKGLTRMIRFIGFCLLDIDSANGDLQENVQPSELDFAHLIVIMDAVC